MIRGGKSYVSSPPAFSNDAKRLLICTGNTVSIFSTSTGLQISALEGHTDLVTTVLVVPGNKILCYCWTASLDGTIRYWDFSTPELLKTIVAKVPIFSMVIPSLLSPPPKTNEKPPNLYAYVSVQVEGKTNPRAETQPNAKLLFGRICKCNLTRSRMLMRVTLAEMKVPETIMVSSSGKYFGVQKNNKVIIWKVPEPESDNAMIRKISLHRTKKITVISFHPTQRIVAVGDVTGRITIWRGFGDKTFVSSGLADGNLMNNEEEKSIVRNKDDVGSCTTWHWHPFEVNVLSFSSDGAYMYSGGKEGVLVVWQLDSGKRKFLPRIGSRLLYFTYSPDPSLSCISCADNQIHLLKMPSMETLKSISGIKLPCPLPKEYEGLYSRVAFDQSAASVALHTENYCIQFYSLLDDRGISEVQVTERNYQPGDDVTVVVTLVALSQDGSMMSTVEVKHAEDGIGGLVCLKFWALGSLNKEFSLSTIIYEPHKNASISAVVFHPTRRAAVTTSYGGDFKVWVGSDELLPEDVKLQNCGWSCHAVGSYKKKAMTAAAFSADGSVLAVAVETMITLWDPDKNVLVAVIGETLTPIVNLSFVGKSDFLVATSWGSKPQLSVWSMSKMSVFWSNMLHVEAVACAADLLSFAVLALLPESFDSKKSKETTFQGRDGVIILFNAMDPVPVTTWSARKAKGGALSFLQLTQSSVEKISDENPPHLLAYMNGDHEYILFDPFAKEIHERSVSRKEGLVAPEETGSSLCDHNGAQFIFASPHASLGPLNMFETLALNGPVQIDGSTSYFQCGGQFGYASIYGELQEFELKRNQTLSVPSAPSEKPWETIFRGPSHNLPPLTKLCSVFLESMLEKRTVVAE